MNFPRIDPRFVAGMASFPELFVNVAMLRGQDREGATALCELVPSALRETICFLDRISGRWLYDFGDPINTDTGFVWGVGKTWHEITTLIDVMVCATKRLRESIRADYLLRLADPRKHDDMLIEFAPILRLDEETAVVYEVTGQSPESRKIDWKIVGSDGFSILLEVKNRIADLIRSFHRIEAGESRPDGTAPEPDHNTDLLFKSIEKKFLPGDPTHMPQGAWIHSGLQQDRVEVERSFQKLDPTKVHFAILGSWDSEIHLMSRGELPRTKIIELLHVREGGRLVFDR